MNNRYRNNAKIEKFRGRLKSAKMNKKYKVRFPDSPQFHIINWK